MQQGETMSALEVVMMKRIGELKAEIEALKAENERLKIYDVEHWQDQWLLVVEDNNKLRAENERLRASSFVTAVPVEEYEKLKAEVERLRKAGDAMALCITEFRCGKYGNALDKVGGFYVWQDWLAAKEGKQS